MLRRIFLCIAIVAFICIFAFQKGEETIEVFGRGNIMEAEERAQTLIKELYKRGVVFKTEEGNGTEYLKRYYCSNICIDILEDGSIRYLSDVNDADGKDEFLEWLYLSDNVQIISESEFYGFIKRTVKAGGIICNLCLDKADGRVVAAVILFNS